MDYVTDATATVQMRLSGRHACIACHMRIENENNENNY